ncbi:hypothetical protein AAC387_Pa10g1627 [Persea americana]
MVNPSRKEEEEEEGIKALHHLKSVDPPLYISPSLDLARSARSASQYLFSALLPSCPKSPLDRLLVDGFDAEQVWHQIVLQSQPLISELRRELKRFERNPPQFSTLSIAEAVEELKDEDFGKEDGEREDVEGEDEQSEGFEEDSGGIGEEDEEDEEEEEEEVEEGGDGGNGIEDRFLKIKELEEYLEEDEEREYGSSKEKRGGGRSDSEEDEEEEEEDEDGDEEEEEDDEIGGFAGGDEEDGDLKNIRYEDFFGGKKKQSSKKRRESFDDLEEEEDEDLDNQNKGDLSTHEKELLKARSKIEQMEKENIGPKSWTMLGEVTASKRPKNSALEVDLDFEHNVRPAPVITEEVTTSLEVLIKKRILEGHFDDVQKAPNFPTKAPKALKELDENKSQKGLAELYEEEFAQKTGLSSAPLSFSDEQKKEATLLFKKLCLKLDALSHFHFTPKPVIEDMSINVNVPALAMEEVAPMAVSDAAMLAPEEVFAGKGDIKEAAELTKEERIRRRANKKRKFRAETVKRMAAKKTRENAVLINSNGKEES